MAGALVRRFSRCSERITVKSGRLLTTCRVSEVRPGLSRRSPSQSASPLGCTPLDPVSGGRPPLGTYQYRPGPSEPDGRNAGSAVPRRPSRTAFPPPSTSFFDHNELRVSGEIFNIEELLVLAVNQSLQQ